MTRQRVPLHSTHHRCCREISYWSDPTPTTFIGRAFWKLISQAGVRVTDTNSQCREDLARTHTVYTGLLLVPFSLMVVDDQRCVESCIGLLLPQQLLIYLMAHFITLNTQDIDTSFSPLTHRHIFTISSSRTCTLVIYAGKHPYTNYSSQNVQPWQHAHTFSQSNIYIKWLKQRHIKILLPVYKQRVGSSFESWLWLRINFAPRTSP